jgi:two-component sensor histidine kinase
LDPGAEHPFVLVTGTLQENLLARTIEQGVDDYLVKDPDQRHLQALPASVTKALLRREVAEGRRAAEASLREAHGSLSELNEALWRSFGAGAVARLVAPGPARLDDAGRLAALARTGMMDSPADASFDRFTDLGAKLLQVPVCLISLVDDHRQFFKSAHGLPEPWASRRETPLSHSFCQHVVTSGLPVAVADSTQEPPASDNSAVTDMGVAAYLGVPLTTPERHTIGSFCAMDTRPRQWTDADRATMQRVAQSILAEIAVHMQRAELEQRVRERTSQFEEAMRLASRAEEHARFLMKELSHRIKNVMAVVQVISWQTAQKSLDLEDFEQRFRERLEALARSQDLLLERDWQGVMLQDLVRAQLEPFLDSAKQRLAAHGPALLLLPAAAQDLGLALHELATNASKYGALSVPTGKINIGWAIDRDATSGAKRFRMTWRESGGPPVSPPVSKGFGSTVVTGTLSRTFRGKAETQYRPEGLSWELAAPIGHAITEVP